MNKAIAPLLLFLISISSVGQSFYMPYNVLQAYEKGAREYNGAPGINYFQNSAEYNIKVNFDPVKGVLTGKEEIVYYNNSPDSLGYLIIRLYHDIFKKGALRDEEISREYMTTGVTISSLKINNLEYNGNPVLYQKRIGTNLIAGLNSYLLPGNSITLKIAWKTQIPPGHAHRFGKYGNNNWFVGYWYPQVAVYDDIDGWDYMNYTGTYEFYNDINNFDVEITVPANHLLWATGTWGNASEILSKNTYKKYEESKLSDSIIHVVSEFDWDKKLIFLKQKKHTYRFTASKVPDFAFALSNNYIWDAVSTIVDSVTDRRTALHAVYPAKVESFSTMALVAKLAVNHFSHTSLKVPYPYANATIFNGGGGMEFPMMVNERNKSLSENIFVTMHELFHAYFPFYTGINERKYAWLDEGLTSYLPIETEATINKKMNFPLYKALTIYNKFSGSDQESPLMTPSVQARGYNYYHQSYYRSTAAFAMLEQYMGRGAFRDAIRIFVDRWKFKHPTGYDFLFTINNAADEDLSWLINPWFFGDGWADLAIEDATYTSNGVSVTIKNTGGFPVPIDLKIILADGSSFNEKRKADIWKGSDVITLHVSDLFDIKSLELGNLNVPDKNFENNYFYFMD